MDSQQRVSGDGSLLCMCCSTAVETTREPVQVSGWYGGRLYTWRNGRCDMDLWLCEAHKAEFLQLYNEYHRLGFYETAEHPVTTMRKRYPETNGVEHVD